MPRPQEELEVSIVKSAALRVLVLKKGKYLVYPLS